MARIPQGSGVTLAFKVWAPDGVTPLDATAPVLTLRRPVTSAGVPQADVVYSGGLVVRDSAGVYHVDVPKTDAAELGRYAWVVAATSPQGVLAQRSFDVIDPFLPGLITLEDARSALGKSTRNVDVDELQLHTDTANEQIEIMTGPAVPRTVVETITAVYVSGRPVLPLSQLPGYGPGAFLTLVSATVNATPVTISQWLVLGGAVVARPGFVLQAGTAYTVTYRVGRQPIPASLMTAARVLVQHLWKTQQAQPTGIPVDGLDVVQTGYGFAIPNRVAELVAPFTTDELVYG